MKSTFSPARRRLAALVRVAAAALLMGGLGSAAGQAGWPARPVRVIVPYAAGQGADVLARHVAQELSKALGQSFVVENRAGAGGNIGTAAAAKAAPDGYTFVLGTNATHAANEFLYPSLGYDPSTDFDAAAMLGLLPMVISTSSPDYPVNGVAELVRRAQAAPNTINVGLPSTTANVVLATFVRDARAPLFGVRYKASSQAIADTMGGQIPVVIDTVIASRPHIASGKLRAIGITSLASSEMLPGVRSVAEQGVAGFNVVAWNALFAPRGTPPEILARLSEQVQRILDQPETRRRLMDIGVEPLFMPPAQLDRFVKDERLRWGDIVRSASIRVE